MVASVATVPVSVLIEVRGPFQWERRAHDLIGKRWRRTTGLRVHADLLWHHPLGFTLHRLHLAKVIAAALVLQHDGCQIVAVRCGKGVGTGTHRSRRWRRIGMLVMIIPGRLNHRSSVG